MKDERQVIEALCKSMVDLHGEKARLIEAARAAPMLKKPALIEKTVELQHKIEGGLIALVRELYVTKRNSG